MDRERLNGPGIVTKVTKFIHLNGMSHEVYYTEEESGATPRRPAWFVSHHYGDGMFHRYLCGGTAKFQRLIDDVNPDHWSIDKVDTYEIVPIDKVPNKVMVALAKWRLGV